MDPRVLTGPEAEPHSELTPAQFAACESVIQQGLDSFKQVGLALKAIRDLGRQELQRQGFTSFVDYVDRRWGWSKSRAYEYMVAAEMAAQLETFSADAENLPAPTAISQLRPLAALPEAERPVTWQEAVRRNEGRVPPQRLVYEVAREHLEPQRFTVEVRDWESGNIPVKVRPPKPMRIRDRLFTLLILDDLSDLNPSEVRAALRPGDLEDLRRLNTWLPKWLADVVLLADPSDPNRLDRDKDGHACDFKG